MTNLVSSMRDRFGRPGIGLLVLLLLGISAYSMVALVGERRHSRELTTSNQALLVSLREMQNQVQSVSETEACSPAGRGDGLPPCLESDQGNRLRRPMLASSETGSSSPPRLESNQNESV